MKFFYTLTVLFLLIPYYLTAQVEYDTVSREVLENFILNAEPERDTASCYALYVATRRPSFPGGHCALIRYVNENIDFPQSLADSLKTTEIYCRTNINKNGKVIVQARENSQSMLLFKKVCKLLETFPLFEPGQIRGENKDFRVFFTFYFTKDTAAMNVRHPYFIPVFPTDNPEYRKLLQDKCK